MHDFCVKAILGKLGGGAVQLASSLLCAFAQKGHFVSGAVLLRPPKGEHRKAVNWVS